MRRGRGHDGCVCVCVCWGGHLVPCPITPHVCRVLFVSLRVFQVQGVPACCYWLTVSDELDEVQNRLVQVDSVKHDWFKVPVLEGPHQADGHHGLPGHVRGLRGVYRRCRLRQQRGWCCHNVPSTNLSGRPGVSTMFLQTWSDDNRAQLSSSCPMRRPYRHLLAEFNYCTCLRAVRDTRNIEFESEDVKDQMSAVTVKEFSQHTNNLPVLRLVLHKTKIFPFCLICWWFTAEVKLKCFQTFTVGLLCLIVCITSLSTLWFKSN